MHRRSFLGTLSVLATGLVAKPGLSGCARRPRLRILMLGGTGFVGPHLVHAALRRGHEVTLFNRGETNPRLFQDLEQLRGDRYPDRGAGLSALATSRTWDAAVDTWQAEPGCVDVTARLLADRVERYVYISSIATYRSFRESDLTEEGPMIDATEHMASFDSTLGYRTRKRAAEQVVERVFGERGTVLRCTSIAGYDHSGDSTAQVADYWQPRFLSGEPLLAPADPTAVVQLIDVRDLADFATRAIENGLSDAYNMVGPERPLPFMDYLTTWGLATGNRSPIVWAEPQFLLDHGVRPFDDIPNWIPGNDAEPGFYRISNARSRAHGLTYRPLETTISDALGDAAGGEPFGRVRLADLDMPGLSRTRELELIDAWHAVAGAR